MKFLLISLIIIFSCSSLVAQDIQHHNKIAGGIEFRYLDAIGINIDKLGGQSSSETYGKSLRFCLGYLFSPQLYVGISVGADRYEGFSANTFPLCLTSRYYIKNSKNTFFVFGEAGPNIKFSDAQNRGYTSNLGLGYKFNVFKKTSLSALLGYNYERSMFVNVQEDDPWGDYISRKSILIGLGINF